MMNLIWGTVLIVFTLLLCWLAQVVNALSPALAVRLGLAEPKADVDHTFYVDGRGEAIWDAVILWTLPVAGVLLLLDNPWWPYFGLVGGGMYLYFTGRLLIVRRMMQRRGIRIGKPQTVKLYNGVLILWGLVALITIGIALTSL